MLFDTYANKKLAKINWGILGLILDVLVILAQDLKVCLRVAASRALVWSGISLVNVSTVAASPECFLVPLEHNALYEILS
jgi:hypothetical protein